MSINSWWNKSACITNNKPFAVRYEDEVCNINYHSFSFVMIYLFIFSYFRHAPICECMTSYRVHSLWFGQILTRFTCVQRRRRHVFLDILIEITTITHEISKSQKKKPPKDWRRSLWSTDPQMKINVLNSPDFHFGFRNFSCSPCCIHCPSRANLS